MTPRHKGSRCAGDFNDFFFETFDKDLDLPRSVWVIVSTKIVLLCLLLAIGYILINLGVV